MNRYAAHYVHHPEKGYLKQQVVEIGRGVVVRIFPLREEMENVEWYPGVIVLIPDGTCGGLVPYHYYPFDFKAMQPVAGTQRKRLL